MFNRLTMSLRAAPDATGATTTATTRKRAIQSLIYSQIERVGFSVTVDFRSATDSAYRKSRTFYVDKRVLRVFAWGASFGRDGRVQRKQKKTKTEYSF